MSDDLSKRGPQDAAKVNVHEDWEVRYWCKAFGCTPDALRAAVNIVGVSSAAVRQYFGK